MSETLLQRFDALDRRITRWMAANGVWILRSSLGIIFLWFGFLKFFPGISSAETLAADTIQVMTFGFIDSRTSLVVLAAWESLIGLGLLTGRALRATLLLLFLQMPGTVMPMFFFPELTFEAFPFVLTIEGQYIVKNLVIVSAALIIGATVRGGGLVAEARKGSEESPR
ncbi:MAG: hypothetical protein AB7N70_36835 [Dehalococcoidia bacterium]